MLHAFVVLVVLVVLVLVKLGRPMQCIELLSHASAKIFKISFTNSAKIITCMALLLDMVIIVALIIQATHCPCIGMEQH